MLVVIMDNATAEYSFIRQFFNRDEPLSTVLPATNQFSTGELDLEESVPGSPVELKRRQSDTVSVRTTQQSAAKRKADDAYFDGIWKQVMEPVLQYADVSFFNARLL
jgi:vacuolar protein sorting-associated protein 52